MPDYNFKHTQHTKEFIKETNQTRNHIQQPFRVYDEVLVIGKFKGQKLSEVPTYYIKWLLNNYKNLNTNSKIILGKYIR